MPGSAQHKTRVVYFDPYPEAVAGAQRTTLLLASGLRDRGWQTMLLTTAPGPLTDACGAAGIPARTVELPGPLNVFGHRAAGGAGAAKAAMAMPRAWSAVRAQLSGMEAGIVHAIDLRGILLAGPPARSLGAAPIWHAHMTEPNRLLNRLGQTLAATVVVPTPAAVPDMPGVTRRKVRAIANAIAPTLAPGGRDHRPATGQPTLVTCARLVPAKGLDILLEAVALLAPHHPGLRATIFGGPQRGYEDHQRDLLQQTAETGLDALVDFAGQVEVPVEHFAADAIYVQPSRRELLPLAIIEAMAAGHAVVASDVGGVADLVQHGVTGLLVPSGSPVELASALEGLLRQPEKASAMGLAGAELARDRFGATTMVEAWDRTYRQVSR